MYAVVTTGGKQYRVEAGSELIVERLAAEPGATVTFDRVLLVADGDAVTVGTPTVDGASVSGTVIGEQLGPKLVIFKFKQKVKYRRTTGHRQHMTRVRIDEISAGGKRARAEAAEPAEKPAKPARARKAAADASADTSAESSVGAEAPAKPARARRAPTAEREAEPSEAKRTTRRRTTTKKAQAEE